MTIPSLDIDAPASRPGRSGLVTPEVTVEERRSLRLWAAQHVLTERSVVRALLQLALEDDGLRARATERALTLSSDRQSVQLRRIAITFEPDERQSLREWAAADETSERSLLRSLLQLAAEDQPLTARATSRAEHLGGR